jgi:large subunit ribosomal protein L4
LKKIITVLLSRQYQRTFAAKTRSEVAGSGKKPWRQKGTGRARAGSKQSPLWIGGGVTFAPKKNHQLLKLNQKEKQLATKILLINRGQHQQLYLLKKISATQPKTKKISQLIKNSKLEGKRVLIVTNKYLKNLALSCRNLPKINYLIAKNLNALIIAKHQIILITPSALKFWLNNK